ncbi:MAG: tetratricopeptide repeat protein [Leptolyngbya sp. SIO1E4]|nr:tetratricopeptide repeat protein [Leptolyngbya sp. SIO1E4]
MVNHKQRILDTLKARLVHEKSQPSLKRSQRAQYVAAINWLCRYAPKQSLKNIDQVKGELEAFYHLCAVSDWTCAHQLVFAPTTDSETEELHERLFNWGYYREQQQLYTSLLHKIDREVDLVCLNGLGSLHDVLGDALQALNYHQQSLALAQTVGNAQAEATALGNLGNAYLSLGHPERSLKLYQQHLEKARIAGNRRSVGIALGNLGNVYRILEDYERAIDCIQQRLAVAREVRDRHGEGDAYGNLGSVYALQGRLEEALLLQQQAIAIAQEIGNRLGECRAYGNLGLVHQAFGDQIRAIECFKSTLKIARAIEDQEGQRLAILQLGTLCQQLDRYEAAIEYQQQALGWVSDPIRTGSLMLNLGTAYRELGQISEAIALYKKLVAMAGQMSNDTLEQRSFKMLGYYCLAAMA